MAQLTGNTVASTYESLIKVADNSTLNASTTELLSDGAGNNLPLKASQTTIEFTGNVNFNTATVQNLNTSDLTNDSGFITIADVNTATASLSASLAADIPYYTGDLINNSDFVNSTYVLNQTASLSASLAVDIATNASNIATNVSNIATNASDILGLDNQVSLLESTASILTTASASFASDIITLENASASFASDIIVLQATASDAFVNAGNEFSEITFTQGDGSTIVLETAPKFVYEQVKNMEAVTLAKGTPVYVSGSTGNSSNVYKADAGDVNKMPAVYILNTQLTSGQEGLGKLVGYINGVDTSTFNAGDSLYVAVGGGYTNVKPTGSALIQKLGNVIKSDANGSGVITGAGRANDVPNISPNYIWMGNADSVATPTLSSSIVPTTSLTASYVAGANVDGIVANANLALSALTATNADNIDIDNVSADTVYGFVFRDGDTSTYQQLYADTQADTPGWNPSTNTITAPIISASTAFSGDLDGNAATATTASYAVTASYVADLPAQFSQVLTVSASLTIDDTNYPTYKGKTILMSGSTALDFELDMTTAPDTGDEFYVVQFASGQVSTLNYAGAIYSTVGTTPKTNAEYSSMAFKHLGSHNWLVVGDIA